VKISRVVQIKLNQSENVFMVTNFPITPRAYLSDIAVTNISRSFTHKMAAKTNEIVSLPPSIYRLLPPALPRSRTRSCVTGRSRSVTAMPPRHPPTWTQARRQLLERASDQSPNKPQPANHSALPTDSRDTVASSLTATRASAGIPRRCAPQRTGLTAALSGWRHS